MRKLECHNLNFFDLAHMILTIQKNVGPFIKIFDHFGGFGVIFNYYFSHTNYFKTICYFQCI